MHFTSQRMTYLIEHATDQGVQTTSSIKSRLLWSPVNISVGEIRILGVKMGAHPNCSNYFRAICTYIFWRLYFCSPTSSLPHKTPCPNLLITFDGICLLHAALFATRIGLRVSIFQVNKIIKNNNKNNIRSIRLCSKPEAQQWAGYNKTCHEKVQELTRYFKTWYWFQKTHNHKCMTRIQWRSLINNAFSPYRYYMPAWHYTSCCSTYSCIAICYDKLLTSI